MQRRIQTGRRRRFFLTLGVLSPVLWSSSVQANSAQQPSQEGVEVNDETQALKRILHLRGGTTIRAIARRGEQGWEYKKRGWQPLPEGAVDHVVLERDVLRQARERANGFEASDLPARAEHGGWLLEQGLLEDGLEELNAVLTVAPGNRAAQAVVAAHHHRFRTPPILASAEGADARTACADLLRFGAKGVPVQRELCAVALEGFEDREALRAALEEDLFASTVGRRSFAAFALGRLHPGEGLAPLIHRAVLDSSEQVRFDAASALSAADAEVVVVPIARTMEKSTSQRVRLQASQALGNMGYAAAVPALVTRLATIQGSPAPHHVPHSNIFVGRQFAFIQDFDVEVAQFQAVADPSINVLIEGQVTDAGVRGIKHAYFAHESQAIRTSLGNLTGELPGRLNKDWLRWWDEKGEAFRNLSDLSRTVPVRD